MLAEARPPPPRPRRRRHRRWHRHRCWCWRWRRRESGRAPAARPAVAVLGPCLARAPDRSGEHSGQMAPPEGGAQPARPGARTPPGAQRAAVSAARLGVLEVTTVADDEVVAHLPSTAGAPCEVLRISGLAPGQSLDLAGQHLRTLSRPPGEHLCTVCTVNDTHLGEVECGSVGGPSPSPGIGVGPGEPPYPETMSRAAAAEIAALAPAAVVAKGDLTASGLPAQLAAFRSCWAHVFGDRLHEMLGNHDVADPGDPLTGPPTRQVVVPGLTLALLDTSVAGQVGGHLSADQLGWLDEVARTAQTPVLVLGHHPPWDPGSPARPEEYFGIAPADSEALVRVVARRAAIVAYAAGHTHRNLVRHFAATAELPWIEVACTKDFPGSWAEYRVFEGGVLQIHRRTSTPEALAWSERCRCLIHGYYPAYAMGTLADRCFAIGPRA